MNFLLQYVTITRIIKVLNHVLQVFKKIDFAPPPSPNSSYPLTIHPETPSPISYWDAKRLPPKHTSTKQKDLGQWYKTRTLQCMWLFHSPTHSISNLCQICTILHSEVVVMWFFWLMVTTNVAPEALNRMALV